jgi:hypothetical protein
MATHTIKFDGADIQSEAVTTTQLTMNTVPISAKFSLQNVTTTGNTTTEVVQFTNPTTGLVTTANAEVGGELTVGGTNLVDLIYPIGAIYITTSAVSPSSIWAGTTWVAYGEGRTMIGHGAGDGLTNRSTVEATGGAETHTLTKAEIPPHKHSEVRHNDHKTTSVTQPGLNPYDATGYQTVETSDGSLNLDGTSQLQGLAHNIMQPYIVTYMWKRTT